MLLLLLLRLKPSQPRMLRGREKANWRKKNERGREGRRRWRDLEGGLCVCVFGGGGEGGWLRQYAEVTDDLSQSLQLFVQSHGLQLESPDTVPKERRLH